MYIISQEDLQRVKLNKEGYLKIVPDNAEPTSTSQKDIDVKVEVIEDVAKEREISPIAEEVIKVNGTTRASTPPPPTKRLINTKVIITVGAVGLLLYVLFVMKPFK